MSYFPSNDTRVNDVLYKKTTKKKKSIQSLLAILHTRVNDSTYTGAFCAFCHRIFGNGKAKVMHNGKICRCYISNIPFDFLQKSDPSDANLKSLL